MVSQALMGALVAGGVLVASNQKASADTHVEVIAGDTVNKLAHEYDSTPDAIIQKNNLQDPNHLDVGQQLDIPNDRPDENVGTDRSTANIDGLTQAAATTSNMIAQTNVNGNSQVDNNVNRSNNVSNVNNVAGVSNNSGYSQTNYSNGASQLVNTQQAYGSQNSNRVNTVQQTSSSSVASSNYQGRVTPSQAVATAQAQVGTPYVWGGNKPGGFDCSGLVQYSYQLGPNYRTTYQQTNLGAHHYDVQNAQSGDLYFWGSDAAPHHVAIAEGNGQYVQAPQPGQNVQQGNINWYRPNYYVSMQNR